MDATLRNMSNVLQSIAIPRLLYVQAFGGTLSALLTEGLKDHMWSFEGLKDHIHIP